MEPQNRCFTSPNDNFQYSDPDALPPQMTIFSTVILTLYLPKIQFSIQWSRCFTFPNDNFQYSDPDALPPQMTIQWTLEESITHLQECWSLMSR